MQHPRIVTGTRSTERKPCLSTKDGWGSEAGFSILEAIVVLLISSMVLSVVLPIVIQSTAQNLRTGQRALSIVEQTLDENSFRRLLRSVAPPRQSVLGKPARVTVEGEPKTLSFVALSDAPTSCVRSPGETTVRLEIEREQQTQRESLVCYAGAQARVLASWNAADATFAYSLDGKIWADEWPRESDRREWERQLGGAGAGGGAPLVSAPLVRLELTTRTGGHVAWIERAGSIEPVTFDVQAMFTGELGAGAPQ